MIVKCKMKSILLFTALIVSAGIAANASNWNLRYEKEKKDLALWLNFNENKGLETRCEITRCTASIHNCEWVKGKQSVSELSFPEKEKMQVADSRTASSRKDFTIAVWCKPNTDNGGYLLLKKGEFGFPNFKKNGDIAAYIRLQNNCDFGLKISGSYSLDKWQYYVLTCSGKTAKLYYNGVLKKSVQLPALPAHSSNKISIGNSDGWGKSFFKGKIKLLRIYGKALSSDTIAAHYNDFKAGKIPESDDTVELQLPRFAGNKFISDDQSYEKGEFALKFNGKNSYVQVPSVPGLDNSTSLTVGAWIKPQNIMPRNISQQGYIVSKSNSNRSGYALTSYYNRGLAAFIKTDAGHFTASAFNVLQKNKWQHVAFSWNGKVLQLYVNGIPVGKSVVAKGKLMPYSGKLTIGKAANSNSQYYSGAIDDVRVIKNSISTYTITDIGKKIVMKASNNDPDGKILQPPRWLKGQKAKITPAVDFEDLSGWKVITYKAISEAKFCRSQEDMLWGKYVGKLTFKSGEAFEPALKKITLLPPAPVKINQSFDVAEMWVSGQYWGKGKGVKVSFEIKDSYGKIHSIPLNSREYPFVYWSGWSLATRFIKNSISAPAELLSITIYDFDGSKPETVYLDSIAFYKRNNQKLPSQIPSWKEIGAPTTKDTILPSLSPGVKYSNKVTQLEKNIIFTYNDGKEKIKYIYKPDTGSLSDIIASVDGKTFQPLKNGGWILQIGKETVPVDSPKLKRSLLKLKLEGNSVLSSWKCTYNNYSFVTHLKLTIKQKSLIVDMNSKSIQVKEFSCGSVSGINNPILTSVPYIVLRRSIHKSKDPAILSGDGLFVSCFMDWYNSEASEFFGETKKVSESEAVINGGTAYYPKTNGKRNSPGERLFLTVSKSFDEVLPNIPNPKSKFLNVTKKAVWVTRMWYVGYPCEDFYERMYALYEKLYQYGIKDLFIRLHENMYRMYSPKRRGAGGPISLKSATVPWLGGDKKAAKVFHAIQNDFNYRMGFYNNYTLLTPIHTYEFYRDKVTLDPEGQWRYGSGSRKMLKTSRMLEVQDRLNPVLKEKLGFKCTYPDQYTCRPPWGYTDYDARTKDAGKFAPAYRVLAQALLKEGKVFGPVLSEGIMQWMFAGFSDSYAQPSKPDQYIMPNFQLRKTHMLSNDPGYHLSWVADRKPENVNKLLAAEIAYGNIGHLYSIYSGAPPKTIKLPLIKSYYMIKQLQQYYATVPIDEILYNVNGKLLPVEKAIAAGTLENNQVYLKYKNGLEVFVNLNAAKNWAVQLNGEKYNLPPFAYAACLPGKVLVYSALQGKRRVDYVSGKEYTFCNGNGKSTDFGSVKAAYSYVILPKKNTLTIIPAPFQRRESIVVDVKSLAPWLKINCTVIQSKANGEIIKKNSKVIKNGKITISIDGSAFKYQIR